MTGLQQDLTNVQNDQTTLQSAVIKAVNTDSSTVQSAISSALTQILNETDTQAADLTTLVTQDNQEIMNTLQANFTAQQNEYYANLKLEIEQDLSQYGPTVAVIQLVLPASQGGYLNSTPVGVQSVVTDDLNAMTAMGASITPNADKYLNQANSDLAAGDYIGAYDNYASCYQTFA